MQLNEYIESYIVHFFQQWLEFYKLDMDRLMDIEKSVLFFKEGTLRLASHIEVNCPYPAVHGFTDANKWIKEGRLHRYTTDVEASELGGRLVMTLFFTRGYVRDCDSEGGET